MDFVRELRFHFVHWILLVPNALAVLPDLHLFPFLEIIISVSRTAYILYHKPSFLSIPFFDFFLFFAMFGGLIN